MKVITFFNNKGGVGKTTTVVNVASYLSKFHNKRILLMDLDPQSNSSQLVIPEDQWNSYYSDKATKKTIFDLFSEIMVGESKINSADLTYKGKTNKYGFDFIPSHPKLSLIEDKMSDSFSNIFGGDNFAALRKLNWLRQFITLQNNRKDDAGTEPYDLVFIDVGPSLGALNRSILLNTDYFITPMGSDIFSILGLENIASWITSWIDKYIDALSNYLKTDSSTSKSIFSQYQVNEDPTKTTRFIGYIIQLYSTRKFSTGPRAVRSYDNVISMIPDKIHQHMSLFAKPGLQECNLKLGEVPYVYSLVPLSQTSKIPIFELDYSSGIRGGQSASVEEYSKYIKNTAANILKNIDTENCGGETNEC